jgi:hypothetical protein
VEYKSVIPYFVCIVDFNGTRYIREAIGRKKDAENLAAPSAILSFIGILSITLFQFYDRLLHLMEGMQFLY